MGVSSGFVRAVWFVLPVASFILLFKLLLCLWCGQLAWFGACPDHVPPAPTGTAVGTSFLAPLCTCLMLDLCTPPPPNPRLLRWPMTTFVSTFRQPTICHRKSMTR